MKTPPPLHQRVSEKDDEPASESAGSITFVLGLITVLSAFAAGVAQFLVEEGGLITRIVLPLATAFLAFFVMFSGMIAFFRRPDAKHRQTVLGVAAGGVALVVLGGFVFANWAIDMGTMVASAEWAGEVEEEIVVDPVLVSEGTTTAQDFRDAWAGWLEEHVASDVKSRLSGEEKDRVVAEVMDGFVAEWSYAPDRPGREEWNGFAARLANFGGHGAPSAKLITAKYSERSVNLISMNSLMRNLRAKETNPFLIFYLELQRGELMGRTSNQTEKRACFRNAINALDEIIGEGWFDGDKAWLLADLTETGHFSELEKDHWDGLMEVYDSHDLPEWFLHYVRGKRSIREAWKARGSGYANTVSDEGWKGFDEHMQDAAIELERSWELAPEYPFAAIEMIQVEMGIGEDPVLDMRQWLDRALSASCDSWPAIDAWFWGMRPRWHGDHESILAFGEHCLATGRFDTGLPRMYLNAVQEIASDSDSSIYQKPGVYESISEMVDGYLNEPSSPENGQYWRTTRAAIALRCGRFDDIRADWLALDREFSKDVLTTKFHDPRELYFRSRIGAGSEKITEAARLEQEGDYPLAIEVYREEIRNGSFDDGQKSFLGQWVELLELQQGFEDGEQIDLVHEGPDFWREVEGRYRRNGEGEMVVSSATSRFAIEHFLKLGKDFEAEVDMATPGKVLREGGAGLHFTYRTFAGKKWSTCYVKEIHSGVRKCKIAHYRYAAYLDETVPSSEETSIHLTCHDERWRVAVNGEDLHKGTVEVKSDYLSSNSRLCLGGWSSFPVDGFELTYRSLKVRKLAPPEKDGE